MTKSTTMITTDRLSIRRVTAEDWKAMQTIWTDIAASPYAQYDNPKDTDVSFWQDDEGNDIVFKGGIFTLKS